MGRFATSWAITKASLRVVGQDKELLVLPVLSFGASILAFGGVLGLGFLAHVFPQMTTAGGVRPAAIALGLLLYLALAFVQVYFGAAVVAGATQRLSGSDPTLGSSFAAANRRIGRLLAWSAVVAIVNVLLQMLRERGGLAGRLVAGLGNMAWGLATYFMLPVLLFEDAPVVDSVGRSASLFRKTWGESVVGNLGVGIVFGLAFMTLVLVGMFLLRPLWVAGGLAAALPLLLLLAAGFILLTSLQAVLSGVYKAALYRFATTGQVPGGFEPQHLAGAFQPR